MISAGCALGSWVNGVAMLSLASPSAHADAFNDWAVSIPNTYGQMLALDADNNAVVAGSNPASTILVAKYTPAGALLWQREFDNPGTREQANWVAVDGAGNVVVVGRLVAGAGDDPSGVVVLKYDRAGSLLWQDVSPAAFAYAHRVLVNAAGDIYVLARGWVTNASGNTTHDILTTKYTAAGTREWTRSLGATSTSADSPAAMVVTPAGNVIVLGGTLGSMLLAAYDPAGNTLWSKTVPGVTATMDLAVAASGEFYAVGGSTTASGVGQMRVIKHDANFNELWRRTYSHARYGIRIAVDGAGGAVIAGVGNPSGGYFDWVTTKIDPSGGLLWSRSFDLHQYNDEIPGSIAVGRDGATYVTGQAGPGPQTGNMSYLRQATVKYGSDGTQNWAHATFASVRGVGIRVGSDDGVFVLGESRLRLTHFRQDGLVGTMPSVQAQADTTSGPAPLSVAFTSQLIELFGSAGTYHWTFGDGTVSAEANPLHVYRAGRYSATLNWYSSEQVYSASPISISASEVALPPVPTSLVLASSSITGGRSTVGTVTVSANSGAVVQLASSNSSLLKLPASIQIPAGSTSASFKIGTSRARSATVVTITASANGGSTSAALTLTR